MKREKELLLWAAENGFDNIVKKVLHKYPDIMEIPDGREIIFHSFRNSVIKGYPKILELLISEFPEIAASTEIKYALIPASYYDREDILNILLKSNPNITKSEEAEFALRCAASRGNERIFKHLTEIAPHLLDSDIARGGFVLAAQKGDDNIIKAYINSKPEILNMQEAKDAMYWASTLNHQNTSDLIKTEIAKAKIIKNLEFIKRKYPENIKIKVLTEKLSNLINKLEEPGDIIKISDILENIVSKNNVKINRDTVDSEFLHIIFNKRTRNFPKEITEKIALEIAGPFTILKNIQKEIAHPIAPFS